MGIWTKFQRKYKFGKERARYVTSLIEHCLKKGSSILDIGCGNCEISRCLGEAGYEVTSIDVKNKSKVKTIIPIIYDGKKLPFKNSSFDVSILIAVLHHTNYPESLVREAARVSKRIIILEDVYKSTLQKYITYFIDRLVNLEFVNHPHKNKNDEEWKRIFKELKLKLVETRYGNIWGVFNVAFYCLDKK